ncbi:MAG: DUF1015 domain-containing protein [Bacteroidetes bacterium]|nr:MAG: DUF1015 domain-containing protein [Bacteroidota bacterium]
MQIKPFQATYPLFDRIPSPDTFCAEAKHAFLDYQRKQWLDQTGAPGMYIYRIEGHPHTHTGLVALNAVEDFFEGRIKQHENTLHSREQRQMELLLRWEAILKPVLLTYPPVPEINAWMEHFIQQHPPFVEAYFKNERQTQRLWAVTSEVDILYLQQLFSRNVGEVYIADGHHRTSTVALLNRQYADQYPQLDFDHLFCAYFAADQLDILDYNRVVEGMNGLTAEEFFARLSEVFEIEHVDYPRKPRKKFALKMYFRDHWYRLQWREEVLAGFNPDDLPVLLDVSLLNELVLHRILGIRDIRNDARITYVEGTKGLKGIRKAVRKSPYCFGFVLYPISFEDMTRVADAGKNLPPKSTYFEPRMKSGFLIRRLGR